MTVKELKDILQALPDEAEAIVTIWTSDGPRNYWFNQTGGKKVYDMVNGGKAAEIAYFDDCAAHRVFETSKGLAYLGEPVNP